MRILVDDDNSFDEFFGITDIKCKIHYAFSLNDLKNLGHFLSNKGSYLRRY